VRHLTTDGEGKIWAGTTSGFIVFDAQSKSPEEITFGHYSPAIGNVKGLKSNDIFWILCDRNKRIWMAPLGGGLAMQSNRSHPDMPGFASFTKKEGLPGDVIFR
jgi:ligand-binding sensor domain-containing protein